MRYAQPVKYYTCKDAANVLGITERCMQYHCKAGNLRCTLWLGRYIILDADLEWFKENRRKPGRPPANTLDRRFDPEYI